MHPLIQKFLHEKLHNPYVSILFKITSFLFIGFSIFWIIVQILSNQYWDYIFTSSYFIIALLGGLWGIYVAQKWGGVKSVLGKAIIFFALGLLGQTFGQIAYTFGMILYKTQIPYPSLGDVGYFGSIPLYLYAILLFAKASGIKLQLSNLKRYILLLFVAIGILTSGYALILQDYTFNWANPLKIFFDFAYPFGDMIYLVTAIMTFIELKNLKNIIMRNKMVLIIIAFTMQFLADYVYDYQVNNHTYQVGQINDYMFVASYVLMSLAIRQLNQNKFKILQK